MNNKTDCYMQPHDSEDLSAMVARITAVEERLNTLETQISDWSTDHQQTRDSLENVLKHLLRHRQDALKWYKDRQNISVQITSLAKKIGDLEKRFAEWGTDLTNNRATHNDVLRALTEIKRLVDK